MSPILFVFLSFCLSVYLSFCPSLKCFRIVVYISSWEVVFNAEDGWDEMVIKGHRSSKSINDIIYDFKVLVPTITGNREPAVEEKSPNQWMFRHSLCFPPGRTPIVIIIMNIILAFIYCHNHPCDNLIIIILVLILITVLVVNNVITLQSPKWPKSGMSPRKWPLPQKRKCFWGWDPSDDSDDMLRWQNVRFKNKKLTFSPKYKNSGVKIWHFWPWRPFVGPPVNACNVKEVP